VRPRWLGPRLAALAAGALWGACFAKLLPFVALAPLFLFLERDDAGWQGFAHGFGAWAVGLWWIAPTLAVYGDLPWYLALAGLALLAAILALYSAAFALAARRFWRRGGWTAWAAPPAIWVLLEWLRERLLTGFPWNQAAYAWTDFPGALALAAWIGAAGVSWVGLLPPLGVALSVRRRSMAPAAVAVLLALLAFALGDRFAAPRPARIAQPRPVRIVQPNTPDRPLYDAAESAKDYLRLLRMSSEACAPGALLVWPESAAWPAAWEEDPNLRADVAKLLDRGCALLLNSPRAAGERVFNSVYLLSEGSEPAVADKRHLVPFGEYVPLGRALPWLGKLARNAGDFSAAESIRLLPWRGGLLRSRLRVGGRGGGARRRDGDRHRDQRRLVRRHRRPLAALPRRPLPRRRVPPLAAAGGDHRSLGRDRPRRRGRRPDRGRRVGRALRHVRGPARPDAFRARSLARPGPGARPGRRGGGRRAPATPAGGARVGLRGAARCARVRVYPAPPWSTASTDSSSIPGAQSCGATASRSTSSPRCSTCSSWRRKTPAAC
jgi:apolipoprotein N-acyltransferase